MRNTATVPTKTSIKKSYKLSKESVFALREIKKHPVVCDSLSELWEYVRS